MVAALTAKYIPDRELTCNALTSAIGSSTGIVFQQVRPGTYVRQLWTVVRAAAGHCGLIAGPGYPAQTPQLHDSTRQGA